MKPLLKMLIVAPLLFTVVGCGNQSDENTTDGTTPSPSSSLVASSSSHEPQETTSPNIQTSTDDSSTPEVSAFKQAICESDPTLSNGTYYEVNPGVEAEYAGVLERSNVRFPLKEDGTFINARKGFDKISLDGTTKIENCDGVE